jgi:cytosine/adenosine deaminase-related metal-dependent hydrolase
VCAPALGTAVDWARRRGLPLAIHLAESPEERELLIECKGELNRLLSGLLGFDLADELGLESPGSDREAGGSSIARAAAAGALGPDLLAIHCNLPEHGEARTLSRAGAAVVFCPRSHAFFGYPPYPLEEYRRAGVRLALGTDSLASNEDLSIRAEARALASVSGGWPPADILGCATGALLRDVPPFGGRGRMARGAPAHWALWRPQPLPATASAADLLEAWLAPATVCIASSSLGARTRAHS